MTTFARPALQVAPGSVVVVRDEEWLVTAVGQTADGTLLTVRGIGELVRDTTAMFYEHLDHIEVLDPRTTAVVPDTSPRYRLARLWLEATIRKTGLPIDEPSQGTGAGALVDALDYQRSAVTRALDPDVLPREQSLIYVPATRAREVLAVTWSGTRSTLLDDGLMSEST